ncbi:P-type conjugative transfer protein TrbJ [Allosphingosinicella sp.]|uniref:P-type conjugative transfer protein TrbJ n=1 Tax=Allosphingosinicella sp. TaxID=2823234 RepID=UPI002FC0B749
MAAAASVSVGIGIPASSASAQITVFDPTNYTQNMLSAARALQQINNQIQSLQNQAAMLTNMAKNLSRIDFSELSKLQRTLRETNRLMARAEGIEFDASQVEAQFRRLFPQGVPQGDSSEHIAAAQARLDTARSALRHTLGVQAQVVGNVRADAEALTAIVSRSQSADGALQVAQATNQLLALAAKQQFQIQSMMAAQYRAEAIERARRIQAKTDARAATARFLGTGSAYTPK